MMAMGWKNLHLHGTQFLGPEMTSMFLLADTIFLYANLALYRGSLDDLPYSGRISWNSQVLYCAVNLIRLIELFPPEMYYDYMIVRSIMFTMVSALILQKIYLKDFNMARTNQDSKLVPISILTVTFALCMSCNFYSPKTSFYYVKQILWAWSHYLEAAALIPQYWMLITAQFKPKTIPCNPLRISVLTYIRLIALYHLLNILHWIFLHTYFDALDILKFLSHLASLLMYLIFESFICMKPKINITA